MLSLLQFFLGLLNSCHLFLQLLCSVRNSYHPFYSRSLTVHLMHATSFCSSFAVYLIHIIPFYSSSLWTKNASGAWWPWNTCCRCARGRQAAVAAVSLMLLTPTVTCPSWTMPPQISASSRCPSAWTWSTCCPCVSRQSSLCLLTFKVCIGVW